VVWELDRLGRSLRHRVDIVTGLADRDVGSVACRRQSTHKVRVALKMYRSGEYTVAAIATTLGVSRASIYRHLDATG
jgi:DNA invertase Pin-like site-specific DNA recombinase